MNDKKYTKPDYGYASDYAYMKCENAEFYYGYEEIDENEEWCFTAKFADQNIKIPFSKLKARDQFNCSECILIGIGWVLTKYKLTI